MRADARSRVTDLFPDLEALWKVTRGDPEITVAVLDGPVDVSHPCLEGATLRTLPGIAAGPGESDHGTHVVSLLFGQPGTAVEGIAPRCTGLILPVFRQDDHGSLLPCSQQSLAQNISQAIEAGADVINVSGGELTRSGQAIDFLNQAVRQAAERNVLIVAAVGNQGCECLNVPAALPTVLSVGALDRDGTPLASSNWSQALQGVMAPGSMIEGAVPGGGVGWMSGTSFATPLVAGIAALLLSALKQRGLPPSAASVREAMLAGSKACDPGTTRSCQRFLNGVLDIRGTWARLVGAAADRAAGVSTAVSVSPAALRRGGSLPSDPSTPSAKGASMSDSIEPSAVSESEPAAPDPGVAPAEAGNGDDGAAVAPSGASEGPPATASSRVEPACEGPGGGERGAASAGSEPASSPPPRATGSASGTSGRVTASGSRTGVRPACGGQSMFSPFPPGQKVFTIGKLYYDFGTEARRDYFIAQIRAQYEEHGEGKEFNQGLVYNPDVMIRYLLNLPPDEDLQNLESKHQSPETNNADAANGLIWTSYIDQDPVYALVPQDQYAVVSFVRLVNFLRDQSFSQDPETFRIAVAGSIDGSVTLFNGTVVPKLALITRGMYDWDIEALIEATGGATPAEGSEHDGGANGNEVDEDLRQFLLRVYDELRNLGVSADDRARNFAATNAYQARQAFVWANSNGRRYKLDGIRASQSPICRRNSECWDISLTFFDPQNLFQVARQVFEYTIDVSDVIPVQVGDPRVYPIYGGPSS